MHDEMVSSDKPFPHFTCPEHVIRHHDVLPTGIPTSDTVTYGTSCRRFCNNIMTYRRTVNNITDVVLYV